MTRGTEFRPANADDGEAIATILRSLEGEPTGLSSDMSAEEVQQWLRRLGDQGTIQVACDGSIPVAFGAIDFDTTHPDIAVLGVWVSPEYRRRGIATDLADRLIEFARERGYRRIRGRLPEGNEPALSFLSSIGAMVPLRNPDMTFELPL